MLVGGRRGWRRRRLAGKGLTRPHAPAREMQSPTGKWSVAGAWILFWCRCLHKSWRSPPGAPSGMVSVGKIGRWKSSPESSPENFAGGEWFLTMIRLTGKCWEMGRVTGKKHSHRKVSRSWWHGKQERIRFSSLALIPCWKRERKEKNLNFHSCYLYLQLRDIYIYKARSPNYHTCDLY